MNQNEKDAIELVAHRVISDEVRGYREHLEKQFSFFKWSIVAIGAFVAVLFSFLFGSTYSGIDSAINKQVTTIQTEFAVNEKMGDRIDKQLNGLVATKVNGYDKQIDERIAAMVKEHLDQVSEADIRAKAQEVSTALDSKAKEIREATVRDIASSYFGIPIGAILPWLPRSPLPSLTEIQGELPTGFRICAGPDSRDDPNTSFDERRIPNLLDDRFLMGVQPSSVGQVGGTSSVSVRWDHSHTVFCFDPKPGAVGGKAAIGRGADVILGYTTGTEGADKIIDIRPKFCSVLYIIRVK